MKKVVSKYPFESMVTLVLIYYSWTILLFERTSIWNKFIFSIETAGMFVVLALIGYTFRKELNVFKNFFFRTFLNGRFHGFGIIKKLLTLVWMGLLPMAISSLMEFVITFLFTDAGGITFGFPFAIYSFTAKRFLFFGMLSDILVYAVMVFFIGFVVSGNSDSDVLKNAS